MLMISIHAARVGCDVWYENYLHKMLQISIHAARVGCDSEAAAYAKSIKISIHAARVGCDANPS